MTQTWILSLKSKTAVSDLNPCFSLYPRDPLCSYQVLSLVANIGCSIGKLFPGRYACNSWQCTTLVHNAFMTLTSGSVDLVERYLFLSVIIKDSYSDRCFGCLEVNMDGWRRLAQKAAQIGVTLAWTLGDTLEAARAAPGAGTLALSVLSCLIQLLLLLLDIEAAWRAQILNNPDQYSIEELEHPASPLWRMLFRRGRVAPASESESGSEEGGL